MVDKLNVQQERQVGTEGDLEFQAMLLSRLDRLQQERGKEEYQKGSAKWRRLVDKGIYATYRECEEVGLKAQADQIAKPKERNA